MKRALVMIPVLAMSLTAFAGKEEREYYKNRVTPAVTKAEATFKAACGCALPIKVSDTLKTRDEMEQAVNTSESITENAGKYCSDADSKKAMCQLKSLDIVKGPDSKFEYKAGKGTAITDGQSYVSWDLIVREVDK